MKKIIPFLAGILLICVIGATLQVPIIDSNGSLSKSGITTDSSTSVTTLPGGLTVPSGTVSLPSSSVQPAAVSGVTTSAGSGDSGKIAKLDATGKFSSTFIPTAATGFSHIEIFTTSATWTNSYNVTSVFVEVIGGGGGSGGTKSTPTAGGGGGGGGYAACLVTVTNGQQIAYTVAGGGAHGSDGSSPGGGSTGGASDFNTGTIDVSAAGGLGGGAGGPSNTGGAGAAGSVSGATGTTFTGLNGSQGAGGGASGFGGAAGGGGGGSSVASQDGKPGVIKITY